MEHVDAHRDVLQAWATRTRIPLDTCPFSKEGIKSWFGWFVSFGIRAFTLRYKARYSHLLFRRGDDIWEAGAEGIRHGSCYEYNDPRLAVYAYYIRCKREDQRAIMDWLDTIRGTHYDYGQILRIAAAEVGIDTGEIDAGEDALICSEVVPLAYIRQIPVLKDEMLMGYPLWRWTPSHIHLYHKANPQRCEYLGPVFFGGEDV